MKLFVLMILPFILSIVLLITPLNYGQISESKIILSEAQIHQLANKLFELKKERKIPTKPGTKKEYKNLLTNYLNKKTNTNTLSIEFTYKILVKQNLNTRLN
ncbi:hypothetical protein [Psychroflexus salis]|nr:hypothetical protein [Psychroflexus salis]